MSRLRALTVSVAACLCLLVAAGTASASPRPPESTAGVSSALLGQSYWAWPHAAVAAAPGHVYVADVVSASRSVVEDVDIKNASASTLAVLHGIVRGVTTDAQGDLLVTVITGYSYGGNTWGVFNLAKLSPDGHIAYALPLPANGYDSVSNPATDARGDAFVSGGTVAQGIATPGAYQTSFTGSYGAFVEKVDPNGHLAYRTYLGDSSDAVAMAVDSSGAAYVTGNTWSNSFPLVHPLQTRPALAFVSKLDPTGSRLEYSTYLGGIPYTVGPNTAGDRSTAIAVDARGDAYVTGTAVTRSFPVTPHAFQKILRAPGTTSSGFDGNAFVSKIAPGGRRLLFSTFLGGTFDDEATGVGVEPDGHVALVGIAMSKNFPVASPVQSKRARGRCLSGDSHYAYPCPDGFISVLDASGRRLIRSTYLGGSRADLVDGMAVTPTGTLLVAGHTRSTRFPRAKAVPPAAPGIACPTRRTGPRRPWCAFVVSLHGF